MIFERSIFAVALVATAAYAAAGAVAALAPDALDLRLLVLLTLGSSMLLVFPHLWVVVYLAGTGRAVRLEAAAGRATVADVAAARRALRRVVVPAALAAAAALGTLAVGQGIESGTGRPWTQAAAFATTLALQVVALVVEWRVLRANGARLAALEAAARA